jgi:ketosteroid isomerase-like protein
MRTIFRTSALLGACLAVALASAPVLADPAAELAAVDLAWAAGHNAGDVETVVSHYTADALLQPPNAPAARGTAAIRAFFAQDIAASRAGGVSISVGHDASGGANGDLGWSSGRYVAQDASGKVVDTGKYLSVSVRRDGKWRYLRDMWNSDGAAAPAAPTP